MYYTWCNNYIGKACRSKSTGYLARKFANPKAAEEHYQKSLGQSPSLPNQSNRSSHSSDVVSDPIWSLGSLSDNQQDSALLLCCRTLSKLKACEQLEVISNLFTKHMNNYNQDVPVDFLCAAAKGMCYLKNVDRLNVIYLLAKGLGTMRIDGSDSLIPAKRMPMGLIEYMFNFFTANAINKVHIHI